MDATNRRVRLNEWLGGAPAIVVDFVDTACRKFRVMNGCHLIQQKRQSAAIALEE